MTAMTKETKIGLLVGMMVIILIGILISDHLSHANQMHQAQRTPESVAPEIKPDMVPPPPTSLAGARPEPRQPLPMPEDLRLSGSASPRHDFRPAARPEVAPVPAASSVPAAAPAPAPAVAQTPAPSAATAPPATASPSRNLIVALGNNTPIQGDVPEGFSRTRATGPDAYGQPPASPIALPADAPAPQPPAAAAPTSPAALPSRKVIHHVQSGETLQAISRKYFNGDATHDKAIFEANRKSIPAMNKLRAGVRLEIPIDKAPAAPTPLARPVAVQPAPAAPGANAPAATIDYTVKEGQTLSSIAAASYGSKNDWPKLYELNKDRIKDPDRLAPGTVIRVPKKS
jgi:nucleoid-associated protein YgaU